MPSGLLVSHVSAGLAAVLVGYTSSVVIIIDAATAAGATPAQLESWLFTLGISMGITSIVFSLLYKVPVLTAWSTPGAALLISVAGGFSMGETIGACMVTAVLLMATGMTRWLAEMVQRIPAALTTAMLAGILFSFGVNTFLPMQNSALLCVCMFFVYVTAKRFFPRYSMLMLLICGVLFTMWQKTFVPAGIGLEMAQPVLIAPEWNMQALVSISFPLYLVTMVSQNLPGLVMLQSHNYTVPVSRVLTGTGLANLLTAPFGGFSCNLAAISAGICMSEEAGEMPEHRYWAAVSGGVFYLLAGIGSTSLVALFVAMPKELTQMLAGFALLGIILKSLNDAFHDTETREGALITLLVTASGITLLGINAPVWGLLAGGIYNKIMGWKKAERVGV